MVSKPQPTLGVHLLETITRGMYSEPFHSIREYIQNAYDSIRTAQDQGLISAKEGQIRLTIDEATRSLSICDNGTGLSPEAAAVYLLDIGNSDKANTDADSARNAGFRGIGRMAGISYCNTLRFETSCGDGRRCVVTFDAARINRLTHPGRKPTTIVEAINQNTQIYEEVTDKGNRYLKVTLEGVDPEIPFLDQDQLGNYLALNAPVAHDPQLWSHGAKVRSIAAAADSLSSLEDVRILICDSEDNVQVDVRRRFRDTFQTKNARGKQLRTVNVTDVNALPRELGRGSGWWGWIAVHERRGALADVRFAGLRIRMHNIAIGDESIIQTLFVTPSLARWCFGEIHVTNLLLIPNAQRDNFEPSRAWEQLKASIQDEIRLLEKAIRRESYNRNNSMPVLVNNTKEQIEKARDAIAGGFLSIDKKHTIIKKLQDTKKGLATQAKKRKRTKSEKATLNKLCEELEQVTKKVLATRRKGPDDPLAHLGKQVRNAVRIVIAVVKKELNEEQFKTIEKKIHKTLQRKV